MTDKPNDAKGGKITVITPGKKVVALPASHAWSLWARPSGQTTSVGMLDGAFPKLIISPTAAQKMDALVQMCRIEISWFGSSSVVGNNYRLDDVFVPPQECSFGGTKFNDGDFFEMFMGEDGKIPRDILPHMNSIRVWGHSHHNMAVFPSGTDEKQTREFLEKFEDYFIRLICNKRGELHVSIYMVDQGLVLHHPTIVHEKSEGFRRDSAVYPFDEWAGAQIRDKVSPMSYATIAADREDGNGAAGASDFSGEGFLGGVSGVGKPKSTFSPDQGDYDPADPDGDGSYYGRDWLAGYHGGSVD